MSRQENTREAGDEDPDGEASNSSEISTSSSVSSCKTHSNSESTSTSASVATGSGTTSSDHCNGSSSTISSGSDKMDNTCNLHDHRHCSKSKINQEEEDRHKSGGDYEEVIERLNSLVGQMSEASSSHYCPTTPKPNEKTHSADCCHHDCHSGKYSAKPETQKHYCYPSTSIDESIPDVRLGGDDGQSKREPTSSKRIFLAPQVTTSLGSSYSNLSSSVRISGDVISMQAAGILKAPPSPSPSLSTIDTNNNRGDKEGAKDNLSSLRFSGFSKSTSGCRLMNKGRQSVCDCLTKDCERKHSNRRQFIENYYNSRTQLPSSNDSASSFSTNTPLNRLSECDAITRRLLSSPIRRTNVTEALACRPQQIVDRSRRASLGTHALPNRTMTSFDSFQSLELDHQKGTDTSSKPERRADHDLDISNQSCDYDIKLKQQQGRSLSVCDEEVMNPRFRSNMSTHSSNLNRAISLACEPSSSSSSRKLLTIIPLFGCDIKSMEQFMKLGTILPPVINSAIDYIIENGINSIGIFRRSGVKSRILTLKQRIEANQDIKLHELNRDNEFSVYDIADLVKLWFRELKPTPLLTKELIKIITTFLGNSNISSNTATFNLKRGGPSQHDAHYASKPDATLRCKIDAVTSLTHRALLYKALEFLARISSKSQSNQMTSQNLAICLTPSLCATGSDQGSILIAQKALEYCIIDYRILFESNT